MTRARAARRHAWALLADAPPRLLGRTGLVQTRGPAPAVYLTFDDGPSAATTGPLLDAFAAADAAGTFFFDGEAAGRHPALVRAAHEAGHAVAAHGWDHADLWRRPAAALGGITRACDALEALTGAPVRFVRPPRGHVTPALLRWARRTGRTVVLWSRMPGDFRRGATAAGLARALHRAAPGDVVVLHESAAVAPVVLPAVRAVLGAGGPLLFRALP